MDGFDPHASLMKIRGTQPDSSPSRSDYRRTQNSTFSISSQKRHERSEARQQLESQIAHLVEEVSHLKAVNRQLLLDKQAAEEAMHDQKIKSDATIAQLRSHVVSLNKKINCVKNSSASQSPTRRKAPLPRQQQPGRGGGGKRTVNRSDSSGRHPRLQEFVSSRSESFTAPTFAELMRRAAPDGGDPFPESLRKNHPVGSDAFSSLPLPAHHPTDDSPAAHVHAPSAASALQAQLAYQRQPSGGAEDGWVVGGGGGSGAVLARSSSTVSAAAGPSVPPNGHINSGSPVLRTNSHNFQDHLPLHSHSNHTYVVRSSSSNQREEEDDVDRGEEGPEAGSDGFYGDYDNADDDQNLPVVDIDLRY